MNLFQVSERHISDIFNISFKICDLPRNYFHKSWFSGAIWPNKRNSLIFIDDSIDCSKNFFAVSFKKINMYI